MAVKPDHVELLRSVPLFAHLPTRSLKRVARMAAEVDHEKGHVVVKQGAGAHFLHIIISGEASVTEDGNPVKQLGAGDYFGEIALIERGVRTATVTAATNLRILGIDATSFRRLVRSDPLLAGSLPDSIADRLREFNERLPG